MAVKRTWVPLISKHIEDPSRLRRIAEKNALITKRWLSTDGHTTVIKVTLKEVDDIAVSKTLQNIKAVLRQKNFAQNQYSLAGLIPVMHEMDQVSRQQANDFLLTNMGIMLILLIFAFRSFLLSLVCVSSAVFSSILAMGLYAAAGNTSNIISSIMPMLILASNRTI